MGVTTSQDVTLSAQLAFYLQKSAAMKALGAAIATGERGGSVVRYAFRPCALVQRKSAAVNGS